MLALTYLIATQLRKKIKLLQVVSCLKIHLPQSLFMLSQVAIKT